MLCRFHTKHSTPISKALFAAFARATRGELDPKDRFRLNSDEVKELATDTGEFIQRYTIPPGTPGFTHLLRPEDVAPPPPPPPPPPPMPPSMPGYPPGYPTPMPGYPPGYMPPGYPPGMMAPPPMPGQPGAPPYMPPTGAPMPPNMQPPYPGAARTGEMGEVSQRHQAMAAQGDLLNMTLDENIRVLHAQCQATVQALDAQTDVLAKVGMAALQIQNMDVVTQVMNRTNAIKAFREKIFAFGQELNDIKTPRQQ